MELTAPIAVGLAQVGEFSFVLASVGHSAGVIERPLYVAMLGTVAASIAVSTVAVRLVGRPQGTIVETAP